MQAQIIDGKALAAQVKAEAAAETAVLKAKGVTPCLAVILVGEDPASQVYVRGKAKDCGDCGIDSRVIRLPEETTQAELLKLVGELGRRQGGQRYPGPAAPACPHRRESGH